MPKFIRPECFLEVFTCPYCDVTAKQKWYGSHLMRQVYLRENSNGQAEPWDNPYETDADEAYLDWLFSKCENCHKISAWHKGEMVYPVSCPVDEPNEDMPDEVKSKYLEAARVVSLSPASAAAMLRLALQITLKKILGEESTGKIHDDIVKLQQCHIDSSLIQALDIIRINGNEAVHPGILDINDNEDDALYLFDLLNMICDQFFTQPRRMRQMYEKLPDNKRILKRGPGC